MVLLTDHVLLQPLPPCSRFRGRTPSPHQTDTHPGEARFPSHSWWVNKIQEERTCMPYGGLSPRRAHQFTFVGDTVDSGF